MMLGDKLHTINNEIQGFWLNLANWHFMLMFWRYILTFNAKENFQTNNQTYRDYPFNKSLYFDTEEYQVLQVSKTYPQSLMSNVTAMTLWYQTLLPWHSDVKCYCCDTLMSNVTAMTLWCQILLPWHSDVKCYCPDTDVKCHCHDLCPDIHYWHDNYQWQY